MSLVSALKTLLVPRKSSNDTTDLDTDWRAIEIWAQQVVAAIKSISGGTHYASLTGPGETVTPGKLTQAGQLEVTQNLIVDADITMTASSANISGQDQVTLEASNLSLVAELGGFLVLHGGTIELHAEAGGAAEWIFIAPAGTTAFICDNPGVSNDKLRFFGSAGVDTGASKQTVSGSRAANAALASLLTALADYGLITDGTTP